MLPFTRDEFFSVFAAYNDAIWPAQVGAYILATAALVAIGLNRSYSRRLAFGTLSILWIWTGVAYNGLFFAKVNSAAIAFGVLFCIQGLVFGFAALRARSSDTDTRLRQSLWGWLLVVYASVIYPVIGHLSGHVYPATPTFGLTPCPLVIFTFGALLIIRPGTHWTYLAIPTLWAIIGGTAALLLGVVQDWVLPIAAVTTAIPLAIGFRNRQTQGLGPKGTE